jgi:hypothetical protein
MINSTVLEVATGMIFRILFNMDSIHLFSALWRHPALLAQISPPSAAVLDAAQPVAALQALPRGRFPIRSIKEAFHDHLHRQPLEDRKGRATAERHPRH